MHDRQVPLDLFVGREAELAQVAEVVTRVEAGQPWLVAIEGDPGVGKTSLARRCLAQAPGLNPGNDLRHPRELRRPAHEYVQRRLPVLHAPTSIPPVTPALPDAYERNRYVNGISSLAPARRARPRGRASRVRAGDLLGRRTREFL